MYFPAAKFQAVYNIIQYCYFILKYILDANVRVCSLVIFLVVDTRDSARQLMKGKCREVFLLSLYSMLVKNIFWTVIFLFSTRCCFTKGTPEGMSAIVQTVLQKQPLLPLPVSVPLHNTDKLENAEEILQSNEARQMMVSASM